MLIERRKKNTEEPWEMISFQDMVDDIDVFLRCEFRSEGIVLLDQPKTRDMLDVIIKIALCRKFKTDENEYRII